MIFPVPLSRPGVVSCAGLGLDALYAAACAGSRSGIQSIVASNGKSYLAGRVDTANLPPAPPHDTRFLRIVNAAAGQIASDVAAVKERYGPARIAVVAGECDNGSELSLAAHKTFFESGTFPKNYEIHEQGASGAARYLAGLFGLEGPVLGCAAACASGASALATAASLIRAGLCEAAVAGGADLLSDTVLLGFDALSAVSPGYTNPFSKNRNGINLGEGAAFFVLSREPLGGAHPAIAPRCVVLKGWGASADAYHITAPEESGEGAARAMREALNLAGLEAADIGYINLHGTGTALNDSAEARAVHAVFGDASPPASSTKPVTGHTLAAAGGLEAAICWALLEKAHTPNAQGIEAEMSADARIGADSPVFARGKNAPEKIPVHVWDGIYDDTLPRLNFVRGVSNFDISKIVIHNCMSNSFAFGGCNISLILGVTSNE